MLLIAPLLDAPSSTPPMTRLQTPQPMQTVSSTSGMNILFPPAFFGSGTSDIAATWQALAHL